jgi:hypothetical protein
MSKIICISKHSNRFTYGKIYTISNSYASSSIIEIITDDGSNWQCSIGMSQHLFVTLEQWRERQLNKLLDE